jgi:DASS family divalent anion:Na+ symporter
MPMNTLLEASYIRSLPILIDCDRRSVARLVPTIEILECAVGDILFKAGMAADKLYYIAKGSVSLTSDQRVKDVLKSGIYLGEEAAVGAEYYLSQANITEPTTLLVFPRDIMMELVKTNAQAQTHFFQYHIGHYCDPQHPDTTLIQEKIEPKIDKLHQAKLNIGWLLCLIVPALVYSSLLNNSDLSWPAINFLTIFSAAIIMWVFSLLPEYIPALLVIMGVIVLGLVPSHVILAGYSSGTFFIALSVFGIGAVLIQSGLIYRAVLHVLRNTPNNNIAYNCAIYIIGLLLTPVLPMVNGRINIIAPLLSDISDLLGYKRMQVAATRLAVSAFAGATLFSACFLTAKSVNFAVFGFFPEQIQVQFTWGFWLYASLVAVIVLFVLDFIAASFFFRTDEKPKLQRDHINAQLKIIGPMRMDEWVAGIAVIIFFVGMLTSYMHKIDPPWIGFSVLFILLALGTINKKGFQQGIDWSFLFMLGAFVGLVKSISFLDIDTWFSKHVFWISDFMLGDFYLFALVLAATVYTIRLFIPPNTTVILMCSILIPLSVHHGINPWLVTFMVLMFTDGWFAAYQNHYYQELAKNTDKKPLFAKKQFIRFSLFSNLTRVLAVLASIPYWEYLGLI